MRPKRLPNLDFSVEQRCRDCGASMVPASKAAPVGAVKHASQGYCHRCYSRLRRGTYSNPRFVDWSAGPVSCLGCGRELRPHAKRKVADDRRISHYGGGMCKRCSIKYGDTPPTQTETLAELCKTCSAPLVGTIAKEFCNITCSSAFYRRQNPETVLAIKTKRRVGGASGYLIRRKDYSRLLVRYGNKCAYCDVSVFAGVNLTWDHVIPLSRGGEHRVGNILPSCRRCNNRKYTKYLTEWKYRESTRKY